MPASRTASRVEPPRQPGSGKSGEKRKEARVAAEGAVRIFLDDPAMAEIHGNLIDVSATGFRAAHQHAALSNGQTIRFEHPTAAGNARVIWNRITTDRVETGFLIV